VPQSTQKLESASACGPSISILLSDMTWFCISYIFVLDSDTMNGNFCKPFAILSLRKISHIHSGGNKGQKLVGCFFEDRTFFRLLIAIPLKMYSKIGRPKQILVGQMLKLVWKMANGQLLFLALYTCTVLYSRYTFSISLLGLKKAIQNV